MTDDELHHAYELSRKIGRLKAALDNWEHEEYDPGKSYLPAKEITRAAFVSMRNTAKEDLQRQLDAVEAAYAAL